MPHLKALYEKYKDHGFRLVSINVTPEENVLLDKWAAKNGYTHPILKTQAGQRTQQVFRLEGTPTNYLLAEDLRTKRRFLAYRKGQEKRMEMWIRQLLDLEAEETGASKTGGRP